MPNENRDRLNQPLTGEGKKQSDMSGEPNKLNKRAEVLQASSAEQNIGGTEEEEAARTAEPNRPDAARKMKSGR